MMGLLENECNLSAGTIMGGGDTQPLFDVEKFKLFAL